MNKGNESLKQKCDRLRVELLAIEKQAREIKADVAQPNGIGAYDPGECVAQSMLAVRHIEDARMRLGKVLQHWRDGASCFDQPTVQAAIDAIPPAQRPSTGGAR